MENEVNEIKGDKIKPLQKVAISHKTTSKLLAGSTSGKVITSDKNKKPTVKPLEGKKPVVTQYNTTTNKNNAKSNYQTQENFENSIEKEEVKNLKKIDNSKKMLGNKQRNTVEPNKTMNKTMREKSASKNEGKMNKVQDNKKKVPQLNQSASMKIKKVITSNKINKAQNNNDTNNETTNKDNKESLIEEASIDKDKSILDKDKEISLLEHIQNTQITDDILTSHQDNK